jgi:hypothetical protein
MSDDERFDSLEDEHPDEASDSPHTDGDVHPLPPDAQVQAAGVADVAAAPPAQQRPRSPEPTGMVSAQVAKERWSIGTIAWAWRCVRIRKQRDLARASERQLVAKGETLQRDINKLLELRRKDAKEREELRERIEAEVANARDLQFGMTLKAAMLEKTKEDGVQAVAKAIADTQVAERAEATKAVRLERIVRFLANAAHAKANSRTRVTNARSVMAHRIELDTVSRVFGREVGEAEDDARRVARERALFADVALADQAEATKAGHEAGRAERGEEALAEHAALEAAHADNIASLKAGHAAEAEYQRKQAEARLKEMRERWRDEWGREWARRAEDKAMRAAQTVLHRALPEMAAELDEMQAGAAVQLGGIMRELTAEAERKKAKHAAESAAHKEAWREHEAQIRARTLLEGRALAAEIDSADDRAQLGRAREVGLRAEVERLEHELAQAVSPSSPFASEAESVSEETAGIEEEEHSAFARGKYVPAAPKQKHHHDNNHNDTPPVQPALAAPPPPILGGEPLLSSRRHLR